MTRKPSSAEHEATMARLDAHPDVTIHASYLDAEGSTGGDSE